MKVAKESNHTTYPIHGADQADAQARLATAVENAAEAIGTLAGGIAHDLNNLFMGIQGHIFLTISDPDYASPLLENLKKVEQHVLDGVELTKQLLGFARGGKYEVRLTDVNHLLKEQSLLFSRATKIAVNQIDSAFSYKRPSV